ncbi:MAG: twitching motility protein [Candidatus Berkelbacteria bacterium Licking1014_7]|uniref:Twitching motility protein n=1 Tax=Candidatus Berkelbacteria bacterium Licking1014_7 TaxID=2017147 RepID=A0A554LK09_9BACT|nr:MAG: twitching motility protein [Candidatus Berkelbacteria bacterium Licking1014_7]
MQIINEKLVQFIDEALRFQASDILLMTGVFPSIRINGNLRAISNTTALAQGEMDDILKSILSDETYQKFLKDKEADFSFSHPKVRFRGNAYMQRGKPAVSLRIIPRQIPNFQQLGLPPIVEKIASHSQGFVLVTGPTGHGKSTTLASIIEHINQNQASHIITIEDPVEFEFVNQKSIISQRQVGVDTESFSRALKSVLREDPNVILIGEMRDLESVKSALTIAETGHLVLSTLHTNSASQSIDRIIDIFPSGEQQQVRQQLASTLLGVFSQRLLPRASGKGRILASEVLITNSATRSLIREGKVHQIDNVISTSAAEGMINLDKVLAELVSQGEITLETALSWAVDANTVKQLVY